MPYTQDSVVLQRLVDQVIAGPETRRKLESAEVTEQRLGEILTHAAPDIWASASTLIAEFNEKQKHEKSVEGAYGYLLLHKPFYLRLVEDILPATFGFAVFSLFSLLSSWVRRFIVTQ